MTALPNNCLQHSLLRLTVCYVAGGSERLTVCSVIGGSERLTVRFVVGGSEALLHAFYPRSRTHDIELMNLLDVLPFSFSNN